MFIHRMMLEQHWKFLPSSLPFVLVEYQWLFLFSMALIIHPNLSQQDESEQFTFFTELNWRFYSYNHWVLVLIHLCIHHFQHWKWTSSSGFWNELNQQENQWHHLPYQSQSDRGYQQLRLMSITSLDYRSSSSPNTQ